MNFWNPLSSILRNKVGSQNLSFSFFDFSSLPSKTMRFCISAFRCECFISLTFRLESMTPHRSPPPLLPSSSFYLLFALFFSLYFLDGAQACSFLVTSASVPYGDKFDYVNHFLRLRGPDLTTRRIHNNVTFVHNLLSMTGAGLTPQVVFGLISC